MLTRLPGGDTCFLMNHDASGLSTMLAAYMKELKMRSVIVETTTKVEILDRTAYPEVDFPILTGQSHDALRDTLRNGLIIHQCLLLLPARGVLAEQLVECSDENLGLLGICDELEIPVLCIVVRTATHRDGPHADPLNECSLQKAIDGGLIKKRQVIWLNAPHDATPGSAAGTQRNRQFADGIMRLVGSTFDLLPKIAPMDNGVMISSLD